MDKPSTKILVVENDLTLLTSLAFTLKRHDYRVIVASHAAEALERIRDARNGGCPVRLLIIDIQLPGLADLELVDSLRKQSFDIPTLVITACNSPEVSALLERRSIKDRLTKPFDSAELIERVSSILHEKKNGFSGGQ